MRKSNLSDMPQCNKKASHSKRVNLLKQVDDYGITMNLCSRHKGYWQNGEILGSSKLKKFATDALVGGDDTKLLVSENLDYIRKQARAGSYENGIEISINAAKHYTDMGDGKFLFGFYLGHLFALCSFRDSFILQPDRWRRASKIRDQMILRKLYGRREHPPSADDPVDLCRCGHTDFWHDYGHPRGECYTCLCPRYEYEQRILKSEARDLESLTERELER